MRPYSREVHRNMRLMLLDDTYAMCRLDPDAEIPDWACGSFSAVVRTTDELSLICLQAQVPMETTAERELRCIRVVGTIDPGLTGVISSLSTTLANKGVSLFVVSTYDTDYLFVKDTELDTALTAWASEDGHHIVVSSDQ